MKRVWQIAAVAASLAGPWPVRAEEVPPVQIAARTELYQVQMLMLSDQQFLTGDAAGKRVTISGEFRIAQGACRWSFSSMAP